jgi:hypothetical protein
MRDIELPKPVRLDPWATSSLLQKSIRRGDAALARRAGLTLYHQRGVAVFRRLCIIAVEDIGIADTHLLQEVARIGTDKTLRAVLRSDAELIDDLCSRMALATKDRSADYLYCAATTLKVASADWKALERISLEELIAVASDDGLPLTRRAVAALLACTVEGKIGPALRPHSVEQLLDAFATHPLPVHDAVLQLTRAATHPFCIMLPLIWSRWWRCGAKLTVVEDELPTPEFVEGIPLYTWDKHTAAGKSAIRRFARENRPVATALGRWVPNHRQVDAAAIAAFYADASPVARRLDWPTGSLLAQMGAYADMMNAGCKFEGVPAVLGSFRENLSHLNDLRRDQLGRPARRK